MKRKEEEVRMRKIKGKKKVTGVMYIKEKKKNKEKDEEGVRMRKKINERKR